MDIVNIESSVAPNAIRHQEEVDLVQVNSLCVKYGQSEVLRNISFSVKKNEITTIVGPSGIGKSSLLFCFNRLNDYKESVDITGEIVMDNMCILNTKDVKSLRSKVGMVFQRPLPFPVSIYKNLDIPLRENSNLSKKERELKIEECLLSVGLWDEVKGRLHDPAMNLSGGQQQRLCFARCLVLDPELLLLDEPTSSLDPIAEEVIEELILSLKKRVTILLVTHKMAQMRRLTDNLVVFWSTDSCTKVLVQAPLQEVLADERNKELINKYLMR